MRKLAHRSCAQQHLRHVSGRHCFCVAANIFANKFHPFYRFTVSPKKTTKMQGCLLLERLPTRLISLYGLAKAYQFRLLHPEAFGCRWCYLRTENVSCEFNVVRGSAISYQGVHFRCSFWLHWCQWCSADSSDHPHTFEGDEFRSSGCGALKQMLSHECESGVTVIIRSKTVCTLILYSDCYCWDIDMINDSYKYIYII